MWFKQAKIFQLPDGVSYNQNKIEKHLSKLEFQDCLPSLPSSYGWVSPIENEKSSLVFSQNDYTLICMQLEEKVLPMAVVNQELKIKINKIKTIDGRKVYQKEKLALKDEITNMLLPKAFSKISKVYAYFDIRNSLLIVDTTVSTKLDKFLSIFKKTFGDSSYYECNIKKIAPILTKWLLNDSYPSSFGIEHSCMMIDPNQQNRIIRCQHQDLSFKPIKHLLQDGYTIHQLSLNWQDKINFILSEDFDLRTIKYTDDVTGLEDYNIESPEEKFHADFYIMTETLSLLIIKLIKLFVKN